jgi:small subunit ribosomal protein S1
MNIRNVINESFEDLFANFPLASTKEEEIIKGQVVAIEKDNVIVDIGLKTEGIVPLKEFSVYGKKPEVNVGDEVEVFLEKIESRNGYAILSREKALREQSWHILEKSLADSENILGVITGRVKGGFTVDLRGIIAFLPGSQVDVKPIKDINVLIGLEQPFKILKMDKKLGNIVVSRRAILEEVRAEAREEMLSKISEGQVLEGVVKNITEYGAFVDLGKIDGLLHLTDISWRRIEHPSQLLTVGQKIKVMVIKFHEDTRRISLGMKQLEKNPWEGIEGRFPKGKKFHGKITNITDYGAFIELEPGIEGLVHVSEISWNKNTLHPKKIVSVGAEVEFMVLDIDPSKHRISLGIKQCSENPWDEFAKIYPVNSIVEGEIKNIVEFGIFVGFNEYVDGLVHISDITWEGDPNEELKNYTKGKNINVKILSLDIEKERISLGIKQLAADPFESFAKSLKKGEIVKGIIKKVENEGITVELAKNVTSFIPRNELTVNKEAQRSEKFTLDNEVEAIVENVNHEERVIKLSIKALELREHEKVMSEYNSNDSAANFGDIIGAAINNQKE